MKLTPFFLTTGRNVLFFISLIVIAIFCLGYIEYVYYSDIVPDKVVNETFTQTNCLVTDKQIEAQGKVIHQYRPDFLVTYTVNGQSYTRWVSANGLDYSYSTDLDEQENALEAFDIEQSYPCWFNPNHPEMVVLVMRHNWASTFPLFIPSIVLLIVLYYLLQNLFQFFIYVAQKIREKNEK